MKFEMKDALEAMRVVRDEALQDAMKVCDIWIATQANEGGSTNPQMARIIASIIRDTAQKIRDRIGSMREQPEQPPLVTEPQWVLKHCECGAENPGCPQGKLDGNCAVWVRE